MLGVVPAAKFDCGTVQLHIGDVVLVCSDGILESFNEADQEFGNRRLEAEFRRSYGGSAEAVLFSVLGAVQDFAAVPELVDVFFDFDKYDIRPGDAKTLDANANWLKSNPNHLVLIEGHCDERGTNEYNLALGERRAKSTMNYLVSQGVQANRITIISYGEERPQCTEHNEACWAKNRRAHFLVKPR